uniref:Uncharacterized protein n=1 Tax=Clastoptera arizonana TaxID=38151 RepID=A0A1B6D4U1_9HEMI
MLNMSENSILEKLKSNKKGLFYSLECKPNLNDNFNLVRDSLNSFNLMFASTPWHLRKGIYNVKYLEPLAIAKTFQKHGITALLHLSATGMKKTNVKEVLKLAKEAGIKNIFALQGDRTFDSPPSDFPHAYDLVKYIRENFKNTFTIGVGGYPRGHCDSTSYKDDLNFLKAKVDAGADFIITQMFFEAEDFIKYVKDCRKIGVNVPIIPGVFTIQNMESLEFVARFCRVGVPQKMLSEIELLKSEEQILNYGIKTSVNIIKEIIDAGINVRGIHFFTLNKYKPSYEVKKQIEEFISKKS